MEGYDYMKTIRQSVFETNSSSTHSICISKEKVNLNNLPDKVVFKVDEFGWERREANRADYLYTAAAILYNCDEFKEFKNYVSIALLNIGIDCEFGETIFKQIDIQDGMIYDYLDNGHIDHVDDLREFVDAIMKDEQLLFRYLFGDSHVYTGNDNSADEESCKTHEIADKEMYDCEKHEYVPNPYHNEEKYDYFFKEN